MADFASLSENSCNPGGIPPGIRLLAAGDGAGAGIKNFRQNPPAGDSFLQNSGTTSLVLTSWEALEQSFISAFGDPDAARAAEQKITNLNQTGTALDYWTEFQTLMANLSWNNSAYRAQFRCGLHWKVKEQLSMLPQDPTDLDELVAVTICIDNAHRENKLDRTRTKASSSAARTMTTAKVTRTPASTKSTNYVNQAKKD
ncbi:Retrotransposon-derived protein PEG10 [Ceratobasidium sp. AG-Ba]|nr:Retrotransposon-derived protein PEG10 [Ceratobasidium sp. AG-Ba]